VSSGASARGLAAGAVELQAACWSQSYYIEFGYGPRADTSGPAPIPAASASDPAGAIRPVPKGCQRDGPTSGFTTSPPVCVTVVEGEPAKMLGFSLPTAK
jgi:hypothetical protein